MITVLNNIIILYYPITKVKNFIFRIRV